MAAPTAPFTLPSITITDQAILDRVLAAFSSDANVYKDWLRGRLKEFVRDYEAYLDAQARAAQIDNLPL